MTVHSGGGWWECGGLGYLWLFVPAGALWFPRGTAGVASDCLEILLSIWMIIVVVYVMKIKIVE